MLIALIINNTYSLLKIKAMIAIEKNSMKAGKFVDTKHTDSVIKNYKQERWVHNSKRLGKEDSLSIWYSLEELEEFIRVSKRHGADGLRVYFGAYDKDYEEQPLYAGRQTVVFVATKQKEMPGGITDKDIYINTEKGSSILAYNVGRPCPPLCPIIEDPGGIGITIIDKGDEGMVVA